MLAILGGSGLTVLSGLDGERQEVVRTPYGEPSGALTFGTLAGRPVVFLARHGYGHTIAPHRVNYRANLWALQHCGASGVVSVASVGSIHPELKPGDLVVPDQLIDYTWGRVSTYFDGESAPVTHVDFTEPYDASLRSELEAAARNSRVSVRMGGVYAVTQGPRLETAAEINRLERDGADLVGMTAMPEAVLARELGLPYAAINVVANYAAGRADSLHGIHFSTLEPALQEALGWVKQVLQRLVADRPAT